MVAAERIAVQLPRARRRAVLQKRPDLAREAVNCNGLFGGWQPSFAQEQHVPTTHLQDHPAQRALVGATPRTGSHQHDRHLKGITLLHNEQCVRAGRASSQHHGRSYHRSTTGTGTTEME